MNVFLAGINKSKYLMLVPTNKSKEKYVELQSNIKDLIRLITKNSDDYDEKYMTIKFNSDDELSLNKTIEIHSMIIVRAVFHKITNITLSFSDECINYEKHKNVIL